MAAKKKPAARSSPEVPVKKDENVDDAIARTLTKPEINAALTIQKWQGEVSEVNALARTLSLQINNVANDNMERPEAMLLSQAQTLDELFNNLARKAHDQTHMPHYETFLRLAFKAQGQCRSTLETLAAIKNPPVIYAKQANISNGHQQINNGMPKPHAVEIKNQPNELLTELPDAPLDTRRTSKTIGADSTLEALGEIDRCENY
jgi:hypothetical protein